MRLFQVREFCSGTRLCLMLHTNSAPLPTQNSVAPEASSKEMLHLADGESDGKIVHTVGSPSPVQPEDLPEVPGNPEVPTPVNAYIMDIKLPDLNQPTPVAPIQIVRN